MYSETYSEAPATYLQRASSSHRRLLLLLCTVTPALHDAFDDISIRRSDQTNEEDRRRRRVSNHSLSLSLSLLPKEERGRGEGGIRSHLRLR